MGTFTYDSMLTAEVEDRALYHLQTVIVGKLRRHESFLFSWSDDLQLGDGSTSVWIHPTVPMSFKYSSDGRGLLNREWVEALSQSANTPGGLRLGPEPEQATGTRTREPK